MKEKGFKKNVMLIWRPEGSISTAQVTLYIEFTYTSKVLPSGRQMSMTFLTHQVKPYPFCGGETASTAVKASRIL